MSPINVWLDDVRPAPAGWVRCMTVYEVMALLKRGNVGKMSLDHDLGPSTKNGYSLVLWMVETGHWSQEKPEVHSMNPVGAEAMRFLIDKYFGKPAMVR